MKVLMFGWEFPPHISGGLGTACLGLTKALARQNIEVLFVLPKIFGGEYANDIRLISASDVLIDTRREELKEFWDKLKFLEVNSFLKPYIPPEWFETINESIIKSELVDLEKIYTNRFDFSGKYGTDLMSEVARYALVAGSIAKENDFDVIHAHDWLTYLAGVTAKKVKSKPLIIHVHATEFDRSGENINQQVYDIEKQGMEAADKIITVSHLTRNTVIKRYGIDPGKVVTIHNGVEGREMYHMDGVRKKIPEKIVTFLGRVTFQKGPDYFVEVAKKVLAKDDNVRFVMAGSGDMLFRIVKRAAQLRMGDKFHFTGFLKGNDVDQMFALSDVYVMPSVSEPFGISPLEAIRSNVPVVISKQSGVAEVLHHAIKVDFWDIDATADAIYGLLHYNGISKMFKTLAKKEVENLKWDNSAYFTKELYQKLVFPS